MINVVDSLALGVKINLKQRVAIILKFWNQDLLFKYKVDPRQESHREVPHKVSQWSQSVTISRSI